MRFFLFMAALVIAVGLAFFHLSGGYPLLYIDTMDPLVVVSVIAAVTVIVCFIAGLATDDYSWVDRLWSIMPAVYAWFYAWRGWPDLRLAVVAALVTLWAARLTFNFARKGGYGSMEDYRWAEVRKSISNRFLWQLFNFFFISFYQNLLFVLFTAPVFAAHLYRGNPLGPFDYLAAGVFLALLVLETVADQQQWEFQNAKHGASAPGSKHEADISRGFLTTGLFSLSRHPNYFGEMGIWWVVYFFGFLATGQVLHWSGIGAVLLTLLFQGSTSLTEKISMRRYPAYADYRKKVSRILPWFPGRM